MANKPVVVVGAGIAGLSAAIRLAAANRQVVVVEPASEPGGKMRQVDTSLGPVDSGPTVFTMREVFDDLLDGLGVGLEDLVSLTPLERLARHAWTDEGYLDLFADRERSADAIGEFAGPGEAAGYRAFCTEAGQMFDLLQHTMLRAQRPNPVSLAWRTRARGLKAAGDLKPFQSMWQALGKHFRDPRLHQLFGRYATYCGSSPWLAPATLMLIAHVEQNGVWRLEGGMQSLARGLAGVATSHGVDFRWGQWVEDFRLRQGRISSVLTSGGEELTCESVICTADPGALRDGQLGETAQRAVASRPGCERSLSAMTWAGTARLRGFPPLFHNVLFSRDYQAEFESLYKGGRMPLEPTVYVCSPDRGEMSASVDGAERVFCLINAPANGDTHKYSAQELATCEERMRLKLANCGLQLDFDPAGLVRRSPTDFATRFPGSGGAIYGQATHGWSAAFRRPGSRSRIPGLYLAGGGVHPGAGVPMVAISGTLAADRALADRALTSRWWPTATAGGTSTP